MGDALDDDLLALFGADEATAPTSKASPRPSKKKASAQPESQREAKKRRRATPPESESDMDMSDSDADDSKPAAGGGRGAGNGGDGMDVDENEDEDAHPYPLEGLYKSEADRRSLQQLSEMQREGILAERQEELQKRADRLALRQMMADASGGGGGGRNGNTAARGIGAGGTGRKKTATGVTKEKTRGLDELKRKRAQKEKDAAALAEGRTRRRSPSPARSRSPSAMSESSSSAEEGRVNGYDEPRRRGRRDQGQTEGIMAPYDEFMKIFVSRSQITEAWAQKGWFEDFIKESWIRFLAPPDGGSRSGEVKYRLLEVLGVVNVPMYYIDKTPINIELEVAWGEAKFQVKVDKVSNSLPTKSEYDRAKLKLIGDRCRLPTSKAVLLKADRMRPHRKPLDDAEITALIQARQAISGPRPLDVKQRISLTSERRQAVARGEENSDRVKEIDEILREADAMEAKKTKDGRTEQLREVNERNRKANLGGIKRPSLGPGPGGMGTGTGTPGGARGMVKTEPGTPGGLRGLVKTEPGSPFGVRTPLASDPSTPAAAANGNGEHKSNANKSKFEELVASQVSIDLGDF